MKVSSKIRALFFLCIALLGAQGVFANSQGESQGGKSAQSVTIKLASLVPEASPWGVALNKMAANVLSETGGQVNIIVYHGGVAGGEADVMRKLRLNQIQTAILTSFGLNEITPEVLALSCPFLIRTNAELDYVLERLKPVLEQHINSKGFQTIAWSKVGFVNFFSKQPVRTPDEMRKLKLGTSDTETTLLNVFKSMGYQLVPQPASEALIDLNTGRVDAVYQSPLVAASYQLFGVAKNFMDFPIAPFMGGIFMNQSSWRSLSENNRAIVLKHARIAETEIDSKLAELEAEALAMMKKNGLNAYKLTPQEEQVWFTDTEAGVKRLIGTMFDANIYNQIVDLLKEYRK